MLLNSILQRCIHAKIMRGFYFNNPDIDKAYQGVSSNLPWLIFDVGTPRPYNAEEEILFPAPLPPAPVFKVSSYVWSNLVVGMFELESDIKIPLAG